MPAPLFVPCPPEQYDYRFKAGDTVLVNKFATFRLESDMECYGNVAFAHARKLNRTTKEWGEVVDYTFQTDDIVLVGAAVMTEAA